jgi:hypothetical protein
MRRYPALFGISVALLVVLVGSLIVYVARLDAQEKKDSSPQVQVSAPASSSAQEVALKAELQLVRDYDQRMQNTVYWSLGVVVLVTVLLAGFSWYTNFRIYERDLASLRDQITIAVEKQSLDASEKLRTQISARLEAISSQQQSFSESLLKQLDGIRTKFRSVAEELNRATVRDLLRVKLDLHEIQLEAQEKQSPSILVSTHIKILGLGLQLNDQYVFSRALVSIEKQLKAGGKLTAHEITNLSNLLDQLPKEFMGNAQAIRDLIPGAIFMLGV